MLLTVIKYGDEYMMRLLKSYILLLFGFAEKDFLNYNLEEKKIKDIIRDYIPYNRRVAIRGNEAAKSSKILQNKYETNKILKENKLPTTDIRYIVKDHKLYNAYKSDGQEIINEDQQMFGQKYVIKPLNLRWGKGIHFIHCTNSKDILNNSDIIKENTELGTLIVEVKLINHPQMMILSQQSLNTLRIVTVQKDNGIIDIIFACVRFSSDNTEIDNWSSGGFAANINLETGIADIGYKKNYTGIECYSNLSKGLVIPYFEEAKDLSICARCAHIDMKSIGWDIAITPSGPVIIEGNDDWDVILPQKLLRKGIKRYLCMK